MYIGSFYFFVLLFALVSLRHLVKHLNFPTTDNNEKTLSTFGIQNNTRLKCDDFLQNYSLNINIVHM